MTPTSLKPAISHKDGNEFEISGAALLGLMQAVLAKGAAFRFRAKGLSMMPFIKDGDVITVAPITKEKPGIGKVVAFIQPDTGQLVVHRVIRKQGTDYLIRGDNAFDKADGWVSPQQILGCVTRVEREGRRVFLGLGLERYLIALLSRYGKLTAVLNRLKPLFRRDGMR